jgi:secretion/DNA translocation related TadE-like protein
VRSAGDRGAAAVLVLAMAAVLVLAGATVTAVAAVAVARQRAATVADLAALAAAQRALEGQVDACTRAARTAAANGARLTSCRLDGDVAEVVAEVRPPGRLGELGAARSRARAGPDLLR